MQPSRRAIGRRVAPGGRPAFPVLLVVGWALLTAAWVGGDPPFAGPDEDWHYARALGVGQGRLVGAPATDPRLGATPAQVAWTNQATREVEIPAGLAPASAACYALDPRRPAACLDDIRPPPGPTRLVTPVGTYQPLPYLLPALAMQGARTPTVASTRGRAASALLGVALLALAVSLLWDGTPLSLLGLLLAAPPTVLFSVSLLNGSGLEIAAAIAFAAALLRLSRPHGADRLGWAGLGVGGVALALSRSASPLWLAVVAVLIVGLAGPRAGARTVRRGGAAAGGAIGAVALAVLLNRVWEARYGPGLVLELRADRQSLAAAVAEWREASVEMVGTFGHLEVGVPAAAVLVWAALTAGLVTVAALRGRPRDRRALAAAVAVALVLPPVFWLVVYRQTGFALQGRQLLPLVVVLPLLAGEVVRRQDADRLAWRRLVPAAVVITAAIQLLGCWVDARRSAVGTDGPLLFLERAQWSPAGGWLPWLLLAVLGTGALLAAARERP